MLTLKQGKIEETSRGGSKMYRCIPAVKKKCGIDCEGTYYGDDCDCAKLNMAYLPPTVRDELSAYRATGYTPEEVSKFTEYKRDGRTPLDDLMVLKFYRGLGFTPEELAKLISIAQGFIRDSHPFEADKILCHVGSLEYLFAIAKAEGRGICE
jgi:hypothetical protein